jgi:hypothetical protein
MASSVQAQYIDAISAASPKKLPRFLPKTGKNNVSLFSLHHAGKSAPPEGSLGRDGAGAHHFFRKFSRKRVQPILNRTKRAPRIYLQTSTKPASCGFFGILPGRYFFGENLTMEVLLPCFFGTKS